jgi:hypothetical protein
MPLIDKMNIWFHILNYNAYGSGYKTCRPAIYTHTPCQETKICILHISECARKTVSDEVFLLDSSSTMTENDFQIALNAVSYLVLGIIEHKTEQHLLW